MRSASEDFLFLYPIQCSAEIRQLINRKERKDRKVGNLRAKDVPTGDRVYFPECLFFFVFSAMQ
jgi:hypothetical protein